VFFAAFSTSNAPLYFTSFLRIGQRLHPRAIARRLPAAAWGSLPLPVSPQPTRPRCPRRVPSGLHHSCVCLPFTETSAACPRPLASLPLLPLAKTSASAHSHPSRAPGHFLIELIPRHRATQDPGRQKKATLLSASFHLFTRVGPAHRSAQLPPQSIDLAVRCTLRLSLP